MPITFDCPCGKQLRVDDEYAGKRAQCPACRELHTVPGVVAPPPRARRVDDPEDEPRPEPVWQDEAPEILARRRQRAEDRAEEQREKRRKKARAEVIGGAVAVFVGLLWLVLVVLSGRRDLEIDLYIYPPLLIIGGVVSLAIGLSSNPDADE